jgi:hypothetical protein
MTPEHKTMLWIQIVGCFVFALGMGYYLYQSWKNRYVTDIKWRPYRCETIWRESSPGRYWLTMVHYFVWNVAVCVYLLFCVRELLKA